MISDRFKNDGIPSWNMNEVQLEYKKLLEFKINSKEYELEKVDKCICGSNNFEVLSEKDRFGLNFTACICRNCGLITTSPRIKNEYLDHFYENEYQGLTFGFKIDNKKVYQTDKSLMKYRLNFLKEHLNKHINSIIEIGCGTGHNLVCIRNFLAENGVKCNVYGCDYSMECILTGKNVFNLDIYQGNSKVLIEKGLKADLIILSHVFEHFTQPLEEIKIIKELLNENGLIYIEVPGIKNLKETGMYEYDMLKYLTLAHMYNFSLGTLENIMKIAGFKLVNGDEFVHSIFALNLESNKIVLKNYYEDINNNLKELENYNDFYKQLTKMYAEKNYNNIIGKYIGYNLLEVFYYLYKSYLEIGDSKEALNYLMKYIEKVVKVKKEMSIESLKREVKDNFFNVALNDLVELLIDLEYNVEDIYLNAIYRLSIEYKLIRKKLFKNLYSQFTLNEYHKILNCVRIDLPETNFYLGKTYKILKQNTNAINYFIKYINCINKESWDTELAVCSKDFIISAYYHLGELYLSKNNKLEAKKCFEKSIELSDSIHIKAQEYLREIDNI
ncbi:methyltransferase domain-containing protein [Clostridium sp. BSD9I1]|uniref:methyltransferase domain-containing protein n=1 Tax=Clostridium sp. BSD9I1 TaxID=2003589 RepID=UPI0016461C69|nr:methyltransferase domain-containing protein [Clostridium sp. BSD9I1]